jgi:glucose dehydrogenase
VKILAALLLLGVAGCSSQSQRFVPFVEDDTILALDTQTGQTCVSYKEAAMTKGGTPMPYCVDLYNSK